MRKFLLLLCLILCACETSKIDLESYVENADHQKTLYRMDQAMDELYEKANGSDRHDTITVSSDGLSYEMNFIVDEKNIQTTLDDSWNFSSSDEAVSRLFTSHQDDDVPAVVKDHTTGLTAVDYETLQKKIAENHDFLLYIGREDCVDCQEFAPLLDKILEDHPNWGLYALDVKAFRDAALSPDATAEQKEFFAGIYDDLQYDWTPTLQHRQGSVSLSSITYLNEDFYELEDEEAKEKFRENNLKEIEAWLEDRE